MIMVPLVAVLYLLALFSFCVAAYYGFRLTSMARKMKIMIMITQDGPQSIVGGIVILAVSQIFNTASAVLQTPVSEFYSVSSVVLLVGSAVMFALGFHKMFSIYLNEKNRLKVNAILNDLVDKEVAREEHAKWQGEFK